MQKLEVDKNINEDTICNMYLNDCYSLRKIGKLLNKNTKTIVKILNKNNIPRRQTIYKLNANYFDKIDSAEKSYFLGLIYADGSVFNNAFKITLQEIDKYIIDNLNKCLNSNRKLKLYPKPKENWSNYYSLSIVNKKMVTALSIHGVVPDKDFRIRLPKIEEKFIFDFIRGYFDGDGYFHIDKRKLKTGSWAICSNIAFCQDIQNILLTYKIESKIFQNKSRDARSAELRIGKIENIEKIFHKMYECSNLYLTRKYEKIFNFLNIKNTNK